MDKHIILDKISEFDGIEANKLLAFLSIYKKDELLFISAVKRKFPHASQRSIDLLFNILLEMGFVRRTLYYSCPICGHREYSERNIQLAEEHEEYCCEYCDEISSYNKDYLGFCYKVNESLQ